MTPKQSAIFSFVCFSIVPLLTPYASLMESDKPIGWRILCAVTLSAVINWANLAKAWHSNSSNGLLPKNTETKVETTETTSATETKTP